MSSPERLCIEEVRGKRIHLPWLFVFILLCANVPDVDFLFGFAAGNPNLYHHMWTHSLAFLSRHRCCGRTGKPVDYREKSIPPDWSFDIRIGSFASRSGLFYGGSKSAVRDKTVLAVCRE
jgi:hypothetical protein